MSVGLVGTVRRGEGVARPAPPCAAGARRGGGKEASASRGDGPFLLVIGAVAAAEIAAAVAWLVGS